MAKEKYLSVKIPISDLQLYALQPLWDQLKESQEAGDLGFVLAQVTDKGFYCLFIPAEKSKQIAKILGS